MKTSERVPSERRSCSKSAARARPDHDETTERIALRSVELWRNGRGSIVHLDAVNVIRRDRVQVEAILTERSINTDAELALHGLHVDHLRAARRDGDEYVHTVHHQNAGDSAQQIRC